MLKALSDLWKYDIAGGTWEMITNGGVNISETDSAFTAPGSKSNSTMVVQEYSSYSLVYLIGGVTVPNPSPISSLYLLDTRTTNWTLVRLGYILVYPPGILFIIIIIIIIINCCTTRPQRNLSVV